MGQLGLTCVGVSVWSNFETSHSACALAVVWYGFVAGPTLSYCSSLFNHYTKPSGSQLAVINLGSNLGNSVGPFVCGNLIHTYGTMVLVEFVFATNFAVL